MFTKYPAIRGKLYTNILAPASITVRTIILVLGNKIAVVTDARRGPYMTCKEPLHCIMFNYLNGTAAIFNQSPTIPEIVDFQSSRVLNSLKYYNIEYRF